MNSGLLLVPLAIIYRSVTLGYPLLLLMDTGCSHHLPVHLYRSVLHLLHKCHQDIQKSLRTLHQTVHSFWHSFRFITILRPRYIFIYGPISYI